MMTAEFMLLKHPVLRFTVAVLFFLFASHIYCIPVLDYVCPYLCSQCSCPYGFCNLCRKLTFNFKNAFSNLFSLKADAIYVAVLLKVLHDIESINIKKKLKS